MRQVVALLFCASTFGKGWRVQRSVTSDKTFQHDIGALSLAKLSEDNRAKFLAMLAFAHHPSIASHRTSTARSHFVSPQRDIVAPNRVPHRNFATMSLEEGGENANFQADAEEETNAENGEEVDWPSEAFPADDRENEETKGKREELKLSLLKMGASYDRGYGASPSARKLMSSLIRDLEALNPTKNAALGVSGDALQGTPPLQGNWRMIWTTAFDVLSLASSPVATVGAIHQIIDLPVATNIIDLIPRAQNILPADAQPSSIVRAEVTTRTSPRGSEPNRVGLTFESVKLTPVEIFGLQLPFLPPISVDLPRVPIPGSTPETTPGYFDVMYLDDDMLIYSQNDPGGLFVLIRVDSYDP